MTPEQQQVFRRMLDSLFAQCNSEGEVQEVAATVNSILIAALVAQFT